MKYLGDTQDEKSIVPQENLQGYISWNSSTNTIQKTINGITTNIVTLPLVPGIGLQSAQGAGGMAGGDNSFAFERGIASADYSFAFGAGSEASGNGGVAFMRGIASGAGSFAIGVQNGNQRQPEASGIGSIAIGASVYSTGIYSVAIGTMANATANMAIAIGNRTIAGSPYQLAVGKYNIEDTDGIYAFIVGNGTKEARSNAMTVDWNGNITANNIITKNSFNNAGINNKTYVTEVSETTVTTEYSDWHNSYYAYVAERGNNLVRGHQYKITFDGVEYFGPMTRWFQSGLDVNNTNGEGSNMWWSKGVTFFGNLSLFCDASGFYDVEYYNTFIDPSKDFPFVITNMYNIFPYISPEKIFIYTKTAGQHTVKIERIDYDMALIPNSLIWGNELKPIYERIGANGTPYTGISIGVNNMLNRKSTFVFGDNNTMAEQAGIIVGNDNTVSGVGGVAVGNRNIASAAMASAFGYNTEAAGQYAESHGYQSISSGIASTSHGFRTTANHRSQFVFGEYNITDDSSAQSDSRGNYIEIVGNGGKNSPSNARTLDWDGNETLAGGITLGKGTVNEVTLTAAQLKQLKQLINA